MNSLNAVLGKPLGELLKACRRVGKDFMLELTVELDEADVELEFGDVNPKY
jgi:hypothetical protein